MAKKRRIGIYNRNKKDNWFVTGMIVGGIIGAALTLLDKNTRKQTLTLLSETKDHPSNVKEKLNEKIVSATDTVEKNIQEAADIYDHASSQRFEF
ncbi:YtxH domain-containing protein [Peribacillus kribbensis]|uniref:YtxH domain-containing protein n=1 Tax=Peribacillus kribbensis TaxID=356658 RepID=UPI0003FD2B04|nr:YtxH domain-containing protein [Peribacillus kribbensis]